MSDMAAQCTGNQVPNARIIDALFEMRPWAVPLRSTLAQDFELLLFRPPAARSARYLFPLAAPASSPKASPTWRDPQNRPCRSSIYWMSSRLGHLAPSSVQWASWPATASSSGRSCKDVHQLRATYGQRAGTFLSNAGVLQVFGVNDHDSARLVSDLLGQRRSCSDHEPRPRCRKDRHHLRRATHRPPAADAG